MIRVHVFSKFSTKRVEQQLKKHGLKVNKRTPDLVICWGGDGTFLLAEHRFPGIPKIIVRKNSICKKCNDLSLEELYPLLAGLKKIPTIQLPKLEASVQRGKKRFTLPLATNDIVIRNKHQVHAIRFTIQADSNVLAQEQIGDGLVISTPFGSTAYYNSITRTTVQKGIGLTTNNTVAQHTPWVLHEKTKLSITINRGDAMISVDTLDKKTRILKTGDVITIKQADQFARIVAL